MANETLTHESASPLAVWTQRLLRVYPVVLLLCAIGYALWDIYQVDGDGVAFMDIADAIRRHDWSQVANAYWNPAYAFVLAVGMAIAQPTRWNELQVFYFCNVAVFAAAMAACVYLVRGLLLLRRTTGTEENAALPSAALLFFAMATLFGSFMRELSIGKVRSDALLATFIFLAAGTLLRLQATGRFRYYPQLGAVLGVAYLTKSYALLPSVALFLAMFVYGLLRKDGSRKSILAGTVLAGVICIAISAPYIAAISHQRGRLTIGESARMNYAFFVDGTDRWYEWHSGKLGHATAQWTHHEDLLDAQLPGGPNVYSFAKHPAGTYPLWFDPSYWTDGLKPQIYLAGHIKRFGRNVALFLRFLLERPEAILFILILVAAGARFSISRKQALPFLPCVAWGAIMFAIYFPVDLQDRYLVFPWMLILLPAAAMLQRGRNSYLPAAATLAAMVFAYALAGQSIRDIAQTRRVDSVNRIPRGAYSEGIYGTAAALTRMGIHPGDAVACMGEGACHVDHYWARVAGAHILEEIEVPDEKSITGFWNTLPNKNAVAETVAKDGAKAIVAMFPNGNELPQGWQRVGTSDYFIYNLR